MNEKNIVVPEGARVAIAKAVHEAFGEVFHWRLAEVSGRAFAEWLRDNPIEPTRQQANELYDLPAPADDQALGPVIAVAVEWQRRMFLAPEESQCQSL